ncbi:MULTISPECIES: type I glyceraldehyde-3-phosphate dehydrogenase [Gammaproteobacteria]|uniref:type I glyceraldehyde-3-phosphate dehydrogenase n=1 Tax=Gammaproteobacteria TaxID=1236 RepID=UPI000DCFDC68|nr:MULTISPECIES: type I glyceraldehyde-3-phosphate dehydrogenase [Gammaproteobacteria]RTE86285.1 type I glyceraldehyde-3-phosphate dehydrogenase [Aliidiomarina sp. B3213]TCZ91636.1 type I glyceraldehyde-3-phosphate dehydrogenase [Lysobacter sp. N42]
MTTRVAINGFGRIGRNVVRAWLERQLHDDIQIVAINDLARPELNAHLLKYDSIHGALAHNVSASENELRIDDYSILLLREREPERLPWKQLQVDIVLECTGLFTSKASASLHLQAGANKVLISAPSVDADATIVFGVNHHLLSNAHRIVSNASCTTNCLAPVAKPIQDEIGIESGLMTTVHAFTNDQNLTDSVHSDPQRARAATLSMIPSKTGAAAAVGLVIPELKGKFDGLAVRVPTPNVSLVDLSFIAQRETTVEEVNACITKAAQSSSVQGVLDVNRLPLVSSDFNHNPHSSIFDANQTRVNGRLVKIMAWYDNEWGFSQRMLDTSLAWSTASEQRKIQA